MVPFVLGAQVGTVDGLPAHLEHSRNSNANMQGPAAGGCHICGRGVEPQRSCLARFPVVR